MTEGQHIEGERERAVVARQDDERTVQISVRGRGDHGGAILAIGDRLVGTPDEDAASSR